MDQVLWAVITAAVLGGGAYAIRELRAIARNSDAVAKHVLPHFEPATDAYGRENYEHTLPARMDVLATETQQLREETSGLRVDLVEHMKAEEELRVNDQAHRAMREARYDQLIEDLRAGNPEVRP